MFSYANSTNLQKSVLSFAMNFSKSISNFQLPIDKTLTSLFPGTTKDIVSGDGKIFVYH